MPVHNRFLRALSPALYEKIKPRLRTKGYAAGGVLFQADDRISNLYFFHAGAVSLAAELAGGETIESGMIGCDSLVGGGAVLGSRHAVYRAIVQISGSASSLDLDTARQVAHDSEEFRKAIVLHEHNILAQAQQLAACNATHGLHERFARWLLRARDATGSRRLAITQEFIGQMLGAERTSVSVVAHPMRNAGLIRYTRGNIAITDLSGLQETACECYGTIKAHYDRLLQSPQAS
jgi:CRP-like cAMP-binding protein